jgi:hypothetical protein
MNGGGVFIRGFGDLARGRGGIGWKLGESGAVVLEDDGAVATEVDAVAGDGWGFDTKLDRDPLEGAGTFRHLAIEAGEGMTIICTAIGPLGAPGHDAERATAGLHTGAEAMPYEETLISTQYDAAGDPTRFGLELWPADADQTTRAAATRVTASLLGGARSGGAWAGLFRCHTDGVEGFGTYLLWRA